jgi:hypothetical protein
MESLEAYTRQLEDCRRRWNRRSLDYVLESARILQAARRSAGTKRRWLRWLRTQVRMNPSTASRHLRVARFVGENFALKQSFASLSLSKVYALSTIEREAALRLVRDANVRRMTDMTFARYVRPFLPRRRRRATVPNLLRAVGAALTKAERAFDQWPRAKRAIPPDSRSRLLGQLNRLLLRVTGLKSARAAVV